MAPELPVASPCVKTCLLDPATPLCVGCFRTLDEIAGWGGFSDTRKQAVLDRLPARRLAQEAQAGRL